MVRPLREVRRGRRALRPRPAGVSRRALRRPDVEVVTAAFEEWPLPAEPFDAVVAATALHWVAYTTAEYRELLGTFSGHLELAPGRRAALLECIAALIDGHGGRIVKRDLVELAVARPAGPLTQESPGRSPGSRREAVRPPSAT